jgi:broad specificity phosphatase PhoE
MCYNITMSLETGFSCDVIRHTEAHYTHGIVPRTENPRDLTDRGIREAELLARRLSQSADTTRMAIFCTSDYARTRHVAQICLQQFIIDQRPVYPRIRMLHSLREANFDWPMLKIIKDGGRLTMNDGRVRIHSRDTNPRHLRFPDFFYASNGLAHIPLSVRNQWPEELNKTVDGWETYVHATRRMMRTLYHLEEQFTGKPVQFYLITHETLCVFMAQQALGSQIASQGFAEGNTISLREIDHGLSVVAINGESIPPTGDVLQAFNETNGPCWTDDPSLINH